MKMALDKVAASSTNHAQGPSLGWGRDRLNLNMVAVRVLFLLAEQFTSSQNFLDYVTAADLFPVGSTQFLINKTILIGRFRT